MCYKNTIYFGTQIPSLFLRCPFGQRSLLFFLFTGEMDGDAGFCMNTGEDNGFARIGDEEEYGFNGIRDDDGE